MVYLADRPEDFGSQWKSILKFRPEFHTINTILKRVQDISSRRGIQYCASQWFHGEEGEPSANSIHALGLKRATLQVAAESGADENEARAVASLVSMLMPPCCNGECSVKRMPKPTTT